MTRSDLFRCCIILAAMLNLVGAGPAAAQSPSFEDVAVAAGINTAGIGATAGVSFFDFTGDGWDDITFVLKSGVVRLLANNRDGTFSVFTPPNTATDGPGDLFAGGTWGAPIWFDANGDAWPDLLVGGTKTALFLGSEDGSLTDITEAVLEAVVLPVPQPVVAAAVADVDGDGWNDLFLAVIGGPDMLFRFVGNVISGEPDDDMPVPHYENVASERGIVDPPGSQPMQSVFIDIDRDGDMDLYSVYDGQTRSRLFINDGTGHFTEQAALWGLDDIGPGNSMGITVADVNHDGYPDFYISRIGTGGLFVSLEPSGGGAADNSPPVTYTEVADAWGAAHNGMSWGTVFLDADQDGDEDLAVVHTSSFNGTPALFFERTGPSTFLERGADAGFGFMADNQGLAAGDFDRDGFPDLVIPATTGAHRLLRNMTGDAGADPPQGLAVRLHGPPGNRTSIGARVRLSEQTRYVLGGESFMSQSGTILLPRMEGQLDVTWPDGFTATRTLSATDFLSGDAADGRVDMVHASVTHIATRPDASPARETPRPVVWPNPAPAGIAWPFQVSWPGAVGATGWELYDITGRRISPDVPLAPGVYVVVASGTGRGAATRASRPVVVR
ncbi:MAG: hypothetical protein COV99_12645 [Bacteroidetes bacterium CG12_big_fil_rev_8_21_14_0_65_60_17]|nr:MAG: hypothetical protein COV99_12645 [Bacteroidetes bacterium CG12_big_fil_rev_8_21_14_0_65_60_17]